MTLQSNYFIACSQIESLPRISCGHTKTAAIIKEELGPHYLEKNTFKDIFYPVLMDDNTDKTDKCCIIVIHIFDTYEGDVIRFLDIPIVNIGTAQNLFRALLVLKG